MNANNAEIESIVDAATKLARHKHHQYVMTEHLLLALVRHPPFRKVLSKFGADVDLLDTELDAYLLSLKSPVNDDDDYTPKRTQGLDRVFNRANVQAMFTGRRNITTLDVYLAIMHENNSHAHYFLLKYGVKKHEFAEFWQQHYRQDQSGMTVDQANQILMITGPNMAGKSTYGTLL